MAKLTEKTIGKWFEGKFQDMLNEMRNEVEDRTSYIRLYDSTSSRGKFLPAQPGDFIVAHNHTAYLVECKSSVKHKTLRSCLASHVKGDQVALMRMWVATGTPSCFIFYSDVDQCVEIWRGCDVCEAKVSGKPLRKDGYVKRFDMDCSNHTFKLYLQMVKEEHAL